MSIPYDITAVNSLDPANIGDPLAYAVGINVFGGLYRYDDHLREQPDIAVGQPDISPDGLTYTFRLNSKATFWNSDPVTSADFVYSWNRAATQGGLADTSFGPIVGYKAIAAASLAGVTPLMSLGVSGPDPHTLIVHLTAPSGSWMAGLALPPAWVVDQKAITAYGAASWWTNPAGLVGTGPFRLSATVPRGTFVFTPIAHWWRGSTGDLTRIELHVLSNAASQWQAYRTGDIDIIGFGIPESQTGVPELASSQTPELESLRSDPKHRGEIHSWTVGRTEWVGFDFQSGPFSRRDASDLRQAFSQALDRSALARAACEHGWMCTPATGGLIAKGLQGYLGESADQTARFDPARARATIARLDPDGSRLHGLTYAYGPASPFLAAVARNLHDQWKANLGIDVSVRGLDRDTFVFGRAGGQWPLFRGSWLADFDHPSDWFDNLFTRNAETTTRNAGEGYSNATFDSVVSAADQLPLENALPGYKRAGRMLLDDHAIAILFYSVRTTVVKPYVDGYGANPLVDYGWSSIRILRH
jgi:oligopeptide transport system substrate-binding protein